MNITESALRRIVREEIVGQAVREGRMSPRQGRRIVESVLPDEIKSMGLKVGPDSGPTKFEKGKVYDIETEPTYKIVPTGTDGASMTSTLVYAKKSTGLEIVSTYDKEKDQTTSILKGPKGTIKKTGPSEGDISANHGKHATFLKNFHDAE